MVTGIDKFKDYFAEYENNYIIIGGTACDILEENAGQIPRATKDILTLLNGKQTVGPLMKRTSVNIEVIFLDWLPH